MKASLASATSVIALLVFDSRAANATLTLNPTSLSLYGLVGAGATSFIDIASVTSLSGVQTLAFASVNTSGPGYTLTGGNSIAKFTNTAGSLLGTFSFNAVSTTSNATTTVLVTDKALSGGSTATLALVGTGVAPVANITSAVGYALVGAGNSGTASVTVSNAGNGNLAWNGTVSGTQVGTLSNLRGTIGSGSVFVGAGGALGGGAGLNDQYYTGTATTTSTFTFNYAAPTVSGGTTTGTVISTFANGNGVTNAAATVTTTLTGTGVAPVATVTSSASAGYVLVGQSKTVAVTVSNTGNGNLAFGSAGTLSNLRGTLGNASNMSGTGFVTSGAGGALGPGGTGLNDANYTGTATTTGTFSYVYTPTIRGATTATVVSNFANGTNTQNAAGSLTSTLVGTGVAPVIGTATTGATQYVRVGTTGTATISVSNAGNGNLSGLGTISNLNSGTISNTLGSGFTSTSGGALSLADSATGTLGFTYTPTSRGTSSVTTTITFLNGSTDNTNSAGGTLTASVSAQGVGPVFQSKLGSTVDTATAVAGGATGTATSTVSFGTAGLGSSTTIYLNLSNITNDANGGNAALTDLTIEKFSITGVNAGAFSSSFTPGTVIHEGGSVLLPITVVGSQLGLMTANLTLFTDESTGLGGAGDTFTYLLSIRIPEPGSMAVLGAGLAGLACFRRRRTQAAGSATG